MLLLIQLTQDYLNRDLMGSVESKSQWKEFSQDLNNSSVTCVSQPPSVGGVTWSPPDEVSSQGWPGAGVRGWSTFNHLQQILLGAALSRKDTTCLSFCLTPVMPQTFERFQWQRAATDQQNYIPTSSTARETLP